MAKKINELISLYKEIENSKVDEELIPKVNNNEEDKSSLDSHSEENDESNNSNYNESDKDSDNVKKKSKKSKVIFQISNGLSFKVLNKLDEKAELADIFPNGNIILIINISKSSYIDKITRIKIRDINFTLLQEINEAHEKDIVSLSIKDNNNFATYAKDCKLKIWSKENNKFKLIETIEDYGNHIYDRVMINKIKFLKDGKIISLCYPSIKIYNKINSFKYQIMLIINISTITFKIQKNFFSLLEILPSANIFDKNRKKEYFFVFLYLKNYKLLNKFKYENSHSVIKYEYLDKNKIIIFTNGPNIDILSLETKKVIKQIKNISGCELEGDLLVVLKKNIFLVGGYNINIYNRDNYELIETVRPPFKYDIKIFIPYTKEEIGIIWEKWTA